MCVVYAHECASVHTYTQMVCLPIESCAQLKTHLLINNPFFFGNRSVCSSIHLIEWMLLVRLIAETWVPWPLGYNHLISLRFHWQCLSFPLKH